MAVLYENPAAGFGGGATIRKSALSPLARSSLDQQIDCLRLARMGVPQCIELWRGFERECPPEARMVADCVGIIKAENKGAEKQVSQVLSKAYKKAARKQQKRQRLGWDPGDVEWYEPPNPITKREMWTDEQLVQAAIRRDYIGTDDPAARAAAEKSLSHDARYWYQKERLRDPIRARVAAEMGLTVDDLIGSGNGA